MSETKMVVLTAKEGDVRWLKDESLEAMQKAVGGLIEYVPIQRATPILFPAPSKKWGIIEDIIVNEEGLLHGLVHNSLASTFANDGELVGHFNLVGDAIIVFRDSDMDCSAAEAEQYFVKCLPKGLPNDLREMAENHLTNLTQKGQDVWDEGMDLDEEIARHHDIPIEVVREVLTNVDSRCWFGTTNSNLIDMSRFGENDD